MKGIQSHSAVSLKMLFFFKFLILSSFLKERYETVNFLFSTRIDSYIPYCCHTLCHGDFFGLLSGHFRFPPGVFCEEKPFDDFCLCSSSAVHAMPSLSWRTEGKRLSSHVNAAPNISVNSEMSRLMCDAGGLLMLAKPPLCLCGNVK